MSHTITIIRDGVPYVGTPEDLRALFTVEAPAKAAPKATKAPAKPKAECPAWIVEAAKNRDARSALAKAMRANGEDPHGALWYQRKAEAGIK
jgi:hypothetical protein